MFGIKTRFQKGIIPWNTGLSAKDDQRIKKSVEAAHVACRGKPSWNNGLKGYMAKEKNGMWKGEKVSYSGIHKWIHKNFIRQDNCEGCGTKIKKLTWANISKEYKREREDWLQLCYKCHWHYDRAQLTV